MTKQEFERRIEGARGIVIKDEESGVCSALLDSFENVRGIEEIFTIYFEGETLAGYFLDDCYNNDSMTQLERRLVFLESFRGFCECYELYKEW